VTDVWDATVVETLAPATIFDLSGRVALITGAAGGIGRWLAAGLGAAGASVVLTDHHAQPLAEVTEVLSTAGVACVDVSADLRDPRTPDQLIEAAAAFGGRLDVLVNCAAINRRLPLFEVDATTYDTLMDVDLRAPFFVAQAAARVMAERGAGAIINVSSINAAVGIETVGVYGPAKAALSQLTKVMAVEWAHLGIRANALAPGFVRTPLTEPLWRDPQRSGWIRDRTPADRPGHPAELVGTCLLLASDAGSYLNGQTLYVDGGFLAGSRWDRNRRDQ
jgi:NAD(P)-dependent dehydrogenase (short-subunit alcohol dehydrogenase family)